MKNIYLIAVLFSLAFPAFSQTYYIYTATQSGDWSDANMWSVTVRTDNKKKNKVIIPAGKTVSVDKHADGTVLGEVELEVSGKLHLLKNTDLVLAQNSSIILTNGTVDVESTKNPKESIKIGTVVKFDADLQSAIAGYYYADLSTGTAPNGFVTMSILPVNFVSFTASKSNDVIALNWVTSSEINNRQFEVEKSKDGVNWSKIAVVSPSTNTGTLNKYNYSDVSSKNTPVYYRIRQVDFDGNSTYSAVKIISASKTETETLIYVSGKNTVTVDLRKPTENALMIRLINMNGVVIGQKIFNQDASKISLTASNITTGTYIVQISDMKGVSSSKLVLL